MASRPFSLLSFQQLRLISPDVRLQGTKLGAAFRQAMSRTGWSDKHMDRAPTHVTVGKNGVLWEHRAGPPTPAKRGRTPSRGKRHLFWSLGNKWNDRERSRWEKGWGPAGGRPEGTDVKGSTATGHFWNWSEQRLEGEAREACGVRILGPQGRNQEHVEGA